MHSHKFSIKHLQQQGVLAPTYDRQAIQTGIVHLGVGAFHRAHQAVYTEAVLNSGAKNWGVVGASLQSSHVPNLLNRQAGLYSLLIRGAQAKLQVIGCLKQVFFAGTEIKQLLQTMAAPSTKIVSLTVTEKGYTYNPNSKKLNFSNPSIQADLENPEHPKTVVGILTAALKIRRTNNLAPFTVLSCDNLPNNGQLLKQLVLEFANALNPSFAPSFAQWVAEAASFPNTMVDRITPATTPQTQLDAQHLLGFADPAAVETEPFSQWVLEDDFPLGRPQWEMAGAIFVKNVANYEAMKLRMLNGAHSMLAYVGLVNGWHYVRDVLQNTHMQSLTRRHFQHAVNTLPPLAEIDLDAYAESLLNRLANPGIAHKTSQIAMDGTQKLPMRIFEAAVLALNASQPIDSFAWATAAWMRFCTGVDDFGKTYAIQDPRTSEINAKTTASAETSNSATAAPNAADLYHHLCQLNGLFPKTLLQSKDWQSAVVVRLQTMLSQGMLKAIQLETNL